MSNPQAIESLVRDLHELANEADGKKDVSGGAYGLQNITAGVLTGGAKRRRRRKRRGAGASGGSKKANTHAMLTKAYMKKHPKATLGQASHAVARK